MSGALLTAAIVTVVVCVAQRLGVAPSQNFIETTQLDRGTGPAGVDANAPVPGLMLPPQVCDAVSDQVAPGPSGSADVALYVYATASVAVVGALLVIDGAAFTTVTVTVPVADSSGVPLSTTV